MKIDVSFLPTFAAAFMLCFSRIGTMVMLLPGLGELTVPTRVRLTLALVLTAVIMPLHRSAYQVDLQAFLPVVQLLFQELLIGAVLGLLSRLTVSALQTAGMVIAQQMGLGFVTAVDPTQGQQGALVGNFLAVLGITMIFATDLHHLVIAALNDSYVIFRPGEVPVLGDVASALTTTVAGAFRIGVQIAAPFLVFGLLFNMGLGILSKLMPQMQVFFVGMPLTIMIGFLILIMVVGAMMTTFLDYAGGVLHLLTPRG
jgi:flagellar biosynthesis protein FliR